MALVVFELLNVLKLLGVPKLKVLLYFHTFDFSTLKLKFNFN